MENNELFFKSSFSLKKLIDFWRISAQSEEDCISSEFAKKLVGDVEKVPELMNTITDFSILSKHEKLVDALMSAVIPTSYWNTNLQAISMPMEFKALYCTPRFKSLFTDEEGMFDSNLNMSRELFDTGRSIFIYGGILKQFYNVDMTVIFPLVKSITDEATGLERYFKLNLDNRFIDVRVTGELPAITKEQETLLSENMFNLQMWYEIIPPSLFEFDGFLSVNMFEVTDQEALSKLKFDLLDKNILSSKNGFDILETRIRTMYRNPDLKLGLASISEEKSHLLNSGQKIVNSFLLSDSCLSKCCGYSDSIYQKAIDSTQPQIIYNLDTFPTCTAIEKEIMKMGIRNILVAPLIFEGETIGLLEIGSSKPGDLNSINALKLVDILPLFSLAMKRSIEDIENRVQTLIKEKCTAIHPSVEWRFRKAAINLLEKENSNEYAEMEEIRFKDVYPLYALSDIRNSSLLRNASIQADLKENLLLAKEILMASCHHKKMPVLDHLMFRIDKRISGLEGGLNSGDEAGVITFLKNEIEPLFEKLGSYGENVKSAITKYNSSLDAVLGIVYNKRKEYEESVAELNEHVAAFLEDEEEVAQAIYPHYFEKYKTDGVEFTMYIGGSISENEKFSHIYLKNIRLWQFLLMCGVAGRAEKVKSGLKVPLELAHLILVQNNPLSIRFHFDQKKFDVDGAYNVHYEIMKKRIDKAEIRGREERLTQPGKIAIVYTQTTEAAEYKQYIEYLQSIGLVEKEVEELELEDLQGVHGLKALRVAVNLNSQIFDKNLTKEEIKTVVKELVVLN